MTRLDFIELADGLFIGAVGIALICLITWCIIQLIYKALYGKQDAEFDLKLEDMTRMSKWRITKVKKTTRSGRTLRYYTIDEWKKGKGWVEINAVPTFAEAESFLRWKGATVVDIKEAVT